MDVSAVGKEAKEGGSVVPCAGFNFCLGWTTYERRQESGVTQNGAVFARQLTGKNAVELIVQTAI